MKDGFYNTETDFEKILFSKGEEAIIEAPWNADTRYDEPQCEAIENGFLKKAKKYDNNFINMVNTFNQYLFDTYQISGVDLEFLFYLVFSAHSYGIKTGAEEVTKIIAEQMESDDEEN